MRLGMWEKVQSREYHQARRDLSKSLPKEKERVQRTRSKDNRQRTEETHEERIDHREKDVREKGQRKGAEMES